MRHPCCVSCSLTQSIATTTYCNAFKTFHLVSVELTSKSPCTTELALVSSEEVSEASRALPDELLLATVRESLLPVHSYFVDSKHDGSNSGKRCQASLTQTVVSCRLL